MTTTSASAVAGDHPVREAFEARRVQSSLSSQPRLVAFVRRALPLSSRREHLAVAEVLREFCIDHEGRTVADEWLARTALAAIDVPYYLSRYPDVAQTGVDPRVHYLLFGAGEHRWPNPLFDPDRYADAAGWPATPPQRSLLDYLATGSWAGRTAHPHFDTAYYTELAPDIAKSASHPLVHYLCYGARELRSPAPGVRTLSLLNNGRDAGGIAHTLPREPNTSRYIEWSASFDAAHACDSHKAANLLSTGTVCAVLPSERTIDELEPADIVCAGNAGSRERPLHSIASGLQRLTSRLPGVHISGKRPPGKLGKRIERKIAALPELAMLADSHVFDDDHYLQQCGPELQPAGSSVFHYLILGWHLGLDPSPTFSTDGYLDANEDVARAALNPLVHYLKYGQREGREAAETVDQPPRLTLLPTVAERPLEFRDSRRARKAERALTAWVDKQHAARREQLDDTLVTVVMPMFNRQHTVGRAVESVLAQSHRNFQLLVVDDGSTDRSIRAIKQFRDDRRLKLLRSTHGGVSAARNVGLDAARGKWIAYLDSDNEWHPDYLRRMLVFSEANELDCAYCAIERINDRGKAKDYPGREFSWDDCLYANFIDLNVFFHSAALLTSRGGFDTSLKRMVDWDLILRLTRDAAVDYAPFVGCRYWDAAEDTTRITNSQPVAYKAVVQARNEHQLFAATDHAALARQVSLRFALRIPAPREHKQEWGDYHFAEGLKSALESLGHSVEILFHNEWHGRTAVSFDVALVLRGLDRFERQAGAINLMWVISHPDKVDYPELDDCDVALVASESYARYLSYSMDTPVMALPQATDPSRFSYAVSDAPAQPPLFVGNSRNVYRPLVRWSVEQQLPIAVYGTRWEQFVPDGVVCGDYLPNESLAADYRSAACVLNDHWAAMRDAGFVSNRILDALAAGGHVVSDALPSIGYYFGEAVTQVETPQALAAAIEQAGSGTGGSREQVREHAARHVGKFFSMDARARAIADIALGQVGLPAVNEAPDPASLRLHWHLGEPSQPPAPLRVSVVARRGGAGPQSSSYIRLISPLTCEAIVGRVELDWYREEQIPDFDRCDVCIVQRTAFEKPERARLFLDGIERTGKPLVVDNDDAFSAITHAHAEHKFYANKDRVLRDIMGVAQQTWFSTQSLADMYADSAQQRVVVPNSIDPRVWRSYGRDVDRPDAQVPVDSGPMKLLYMGTPTHQEDFELILPALENLWTSHRRQFEVTLVGVTTQKVRRPWAKVISPPMRETSYPRFARWLKAQGTFDLGLSPLVDSPFNCAKSDIKFLDYCGLGAASLLVDLPPYRTGAMHADRAHFAHAHAHAWHDALVAILDKGRAPLTAMAARASEYAWAERDVAGTAQAQLKLLNSAVNRDRPSA